MGLAAKDRGIDLTSFGTILDEPPTGLIFKKSMNIKGIEDLRGKNIGYIGHFGKIMVDDLMKQAGIPQTEYTMVRVGMNVTDAIMRGEIDTGIGFTNFQRIELEELSGEPVGMLRIDELDGLGCCCFCSIQFVASDEYYKNNIPKIEGFMRALRRAMDLTIEYPDEAWDIMCRANPRSTLLSTLRSSSALFRISRVISSTSSVIGPRSVTSASILIFSRMTLTRTVSEPTSMYHPLANPL